MNIEYLFKPEIEQKFPRLERLFEQSKEDFWNESTVVVRFWIAGLVFALIGLATLKLR